jgi:hypothetical protein
MEDLRNEIYKIMPNIISYSEQIKCHPLHLLIEIAKILENKDLKKIEIFGNDYLLEYRNELPFIVNKIDNK